VKEIAFYELVLILFIFTKNIGLTKAVVSALHIVLRNQMEVL